MSTLLGVIANPPLQMVAPRTSDVVFGVITLGIAAAAVISACIYWRRLGTPIPLLIVLGGSAAMLLEPIVDANGGCWYPHFHQWTAFTLYDIPVPVWAAACYVWFVGGQALITYLVLTKRPTKQSVWLLWVAFMGADLLLEIPATLLHIYKYYGHQPLDVGGLPLWWLPVNSSMVVVAGALVWRFAPRLKGLAVLAIVPLVVMGDGLANGAVGWPAWLALHSNWPQPVADLAGLFVTGLAALLVWCIAELVVTAPSTDRERGGIEESPANLTGGRGDLASRTVSAGG